ncbi:MAG TPA: riboflavin biosynthesis protein RibF [Myxococcales bacterium]|nr:riboflavin biosynthesis protein RibF [Myxococcales bacterium]
MRTFRSIGEARGRIRGCALAIGNFDGVHLGHQALFRAARQHAALAAALTFEPHPGAVLNPSMAPRRLTTPEQKLQLLAAGGLDAVVVQPFDAAFAAIPAREFVDRLLLGELGVAAVVVSDDFSFGRKREGRVAQLDEWLSAGGARLVLVPKVEVDGLPVSSTRIRELVLEGRVDAAARLLGRPFDVEGTVVTGMGRGRGLGFPTANIAPLGEMLPANGVYAVRAYFPGGSLAGAANLGRKPTFGEGGAQTLEVHLIGYAGPSLVGAPMRVAFVARLRDEMRFPSLAALTEQIGKDVAEAARRAGG